MKLALGVCVAAVVACIGAASSWSSSTLAAPKGLHAFVLRADEPARADRTYVQLPAFAWGFVRGASSYELQLAVNASFSDGSLLADQHRLQAPVTSIQLQVPWMTGHPYALWVRVRARSGRGVSPWSSPFGFNTAWQQLPQRLPAPTGLLRWTPVAGATAYEVWFPDLGVRFRTLTNVADEREYWTFHPRAAATIHWRVRAIRFVRNPALPDKVQVTSYGPYSPLFTTTNPTAATAGGVRGVDAVSDVASTPARPAANALMPGFAWAGTSGASLFRVYVFSDRGCVNAVTVGSVVGGPAWAPRAALPLALPADAETMADAVAGKQLGAGAQNGVAFMADGTPVTTSEEVFGAAASAPAAGGAATTAAPAATSDAGTIALPDTGWPAGRYWWTVVPVAAEATVDDTDEASGYTYHDLELPQDACAAGRVWPFGMESTPAVTSGASPLASGLAGARVVSAAVGQPRFTELPVVTWVPALGAQSYEIQLSRHLYPWVASRRLASVVPAATLPLSKTDLGVWYYRVRGVNPNLPGTAAKLTWSRPTAIRITGDRFVVGG